MSDDDDGDDGDDDADDDDDDDDVDDETTRPLLDISVRERTIGRMADAPVKPSMELCVGGVVVPRTSVNHVTENGAFARVDMVDISRTGGGYRCYKWLWEPLGVSRIAWDGSFPWNLPLLKEIQASVLQHRVKRTRLGGFVDLEGKPLPRLLTITVRGRDLQAVHDSRKMIIDLLSMENMTWFLAELWQDLQQTPLVAVADAACTGLDGHAEASDARVAYAEASDAPGAHVDASNAPDAHADASNALGANDVHGDASSAYGVLGPEESDAVGATAEAMREGHNDSLNPNVQTLVDQALMRLKACPGVRTVCFDKWNGRFKITPKVGDDTKHVRYVVVKRWAALSKTTTTQLSDMGDALTAATDDAIDSFSPLLTE